MVSTHQLQTPHAQKEDNCFHFQFQHKSGHTRSGQVTTRAKLTAQGRTLLFQLCTSQLTHSGFGCHTITTATVSLQIAGTSCSAFLCGHISPLKSVLKFLLASIYWGNCRASRNLRAETFVSSQRPLYLQSWTSYPNFSISIASSQLREIEVEGSGSKEENSKELKGWWQSPLWPFFWFFCKLRSSLNNLNKLRTSSPLGGRILRVLLNPELTHHCQELTGFAEFWTNYKSGDGACLDIYLQITSI